MAVKPSSEAVIEAQTEKRNRFSDIQDFKDFVKTAFIQGSGIDPALYSECIEFHSDLEVDYGHEASYPIHEMLGWKLTRFGRQARETQYAAILKNEDGSVWQAIISDWDEEKQRPYIYIAPTDGGDRAFLPPIPKSIRQKIASRYGMEVPLEGSFWEWVETANIPLIVTEGAKKSLAALSQGYVSIALYGCWCGGKESLIDDLKPFHTENRIWLLGYDRDDKQSAKRSVTIGKKRLTVCLTRDVKCYVEDMFWNSEDGKGIDDLIVNRGTGAFDIAYAKAMSRLEKQFKAGGTYSDDDDKVKPPKQIDVAREIAEKYRNILAFNNEIGCWMRYAADNVGVWARETDEYIESIVYQIILSEGHDNFSSAFVSSVVRLLRHELIERSWNEKPPTEFLPFRNGVLEIATGKLIEHAPGYRLTWQLPRNHSTEGAFDKINKFLDDLTAGNAALKDLLICYCNAVIKGRADLQRFVHLIGLPGTGKGTFSRLIISLIGEENVHTTNLEEWCKGKFEQANAYKKRLVVFPDEDKYAGKIGKFLSLTGQDFLRAEEKNKTAFKFKYDGLVMLMSNFPIFAGDAARGVKRRVITVPCNNVVPTGKRRNMEEEFEPELPAFTNYVLSIADDHVTAVLLGIQEIPECTLEFWENRMRVDSIAAWINQSVVWDAEASTAIGLNKNEGSNGEEVMTLFGSYSRHCQNLGNTPKSHNNFSPDLIDICKSVLNWPIEKKSTNTGKFIKGIRLRRLTFDDDIPTYDVWLSNRLLEKVTASDGQSDGQSDGSEPLLYKESDGSDGYNPKSLEILEEKNGLEIKTEISTETLPSGNIQPGDTILVNNSPSPEMNGLVEPVSEVFPGANGGIITESGKSFSLKMVEKVECDRPQADKLACPPLDDYYRSLAVVPKTLKVDVGYGEINVVATPYKKMQQSSSFHFMVTFPDGTKDAFKKKISSSKPSDLLLEVRRHSVLVNWYSQQWLTWSKLIGQKFRIRRLNRDLHSDVDFIYMTAKLVEVPSFPIRNKFDFSLDSGERIPVYIADIMND
ncbi:DUF3854 domain-containing protein [Nodularia sp. NIES-3585]|uniref:DUF3854 domain-containing protein n=1 Tax=Nodularia sp. NIES-3585 TaxID=1973477 RepID=UPI000B5C3D8B|nr:DUF3854 domain-containing protein [Nodularia sp. NIES-3585]GAX37882.1 primase P4 [Nodularia sp. NIES-3585]